MVILAGEFKEYMQSIEYVTPGKRCPLAVGLPNESVPEDRQNWTLFVLCTMSVKTGLSHEEDRDQQQGYSCRVGLFLVKLRITVSKLEDILREHQWMIRQESAPNSSRTCHNDFTP